MMYKHSAPERGRFKEISESKTFIVMMSELNANYKIYVKEKPMWSKRWWRERENKSPEEPEQHTYFCNLQFGVYTVNWECPLLCQKSTCRVAQVQIWNIYFRLKNILKPLHSRRASILCMSAADKRGAAAASSSTHPDCVRHTKS